MSTEQIEQQPDIRSLPLWKDWIDRNEHRIAYGLTVTMEEMEEALGRKKDTVAFNIDVFKIREALRHRGMNFSERGLRGSGFHVMPANSNANTMEGMARAAVNALTAAVVDVTPTPPEPKARRKKAEPEAIAVTEPMPAPTPEPEPAPVPEPEPAPAPAPLPSADPVEATVDSTLAQIGITYAQLAKLATDLEWWAEADTYPTAEDLPEEIKLWVVRNKRGIARAFQKAGGAL